MSYIPKLTTKHFTLTTGPSIADPAWICAGWETSYDDKDVPTAINFGTVLPIIEAAIKQEYERGKYDGEYIGREKEQKEVLKTLGITAETYREIRKIKRDGNKAVSVFMKVYDVEPGIDVDTSFTEAGVRGSIDDGSGPVENLSQYTKYTDGALWDENGKAKEGGFDATETKGDIE